MIQKVPSNQVDCGLRLQGAMVIWDLKYPTLKIALGAKAISKGEWQWQCRVERSNSYEFFIAIQGTMALAYKNSTSGNKFLSRNNSKATKQKDAWITP